MLILVSILLLRPYKKLGIANLLRVTKKKIMVKFLASVGSLVGNDNI